MVTAPCGVPENAGFGFGDRVAQDAGLVGDVQLRSVLRPLDVRGREAGEPADVIRRGVD